jgi:DsbC/DsbD-like thiol-disulfide interchange protein
MDQARALTDRMIADFGDPQEGGFFFTASDHETLLARPKDPYDGALPGANNVAVLNLIALHRASGEKRYLELAGKALEAFSTSLAQNPAAMPVMLVGLQEYLDVKDRAGGINVGPLADNTTAAAPAKVVTAKARLADGQLPVPGGVVHAVVSLEIKSGWHLYANPTGLEILKPTTLALEPDQPAGRLAVSYPKGEAKVLGSIGKEKIALYEDKIEIPIRLTLSRLVKPGSLRINLKLDYQACDENVCLAPASLVIPVEITINAPEAGEEKKP